jgi:hypothetical protein
MTRLSKDFWCLRTTYDERKIVFFGATCGEVYGKYLAYLRRIELSKFY